MRATYGQSSAFTPLITRITSASGGVFGLSEAYWIKKRLLLKLFHVNLNLDSSARTSGARSRSQSPLIPRDLAFDLLSELARPAPSPCHRGQLWRTVDFHFDHGDAFRNIGIICDYGDLHLFCMLRRRFLWIQILDSFSPSMPCGIHECLR